MLLAAALACSVAVVVALRVETELPVMHFTAGVLAVAVLGAWLIERYARVTRGVRVLGHLLVVATVIALSLDGRALLPHVSSQAEWMLTAAFNVAEWLLAALLLVWAVYVVVQTAALVLGLWLSRGVDRAARQSLNTARLAVVGSTALFAVLSLVLWSVISYVAGHQLNDFLYLPVLIGAGYRSADIYLDARIETFGGFFTPLVLAFTALGSAALLVLMPSLLEEISPTTNVDARGRRREAVVWSERLGRWLGSGLKRLTKTFVLVVPPGAIIGGLLYLAFVYEQFFSAGPAGAWAKWVAGWLDYLQGETLVSAGKWLAGGALTIAALGSRFTRTFGRLRVTLDAVLDVDNYFRDPPNLQPPRARIYSRYASLLVYLRDHAYARIVIVSHSQGTVISADLLRYLHVQRRLPDVIGDIPIALVTVGSPLRDLYAEHFPLLYGWMGSNAVDFATAGPSAADIGAVEWVNAFRSGDYVGRLRLGAAGRFVSHRADRIGWPSRSRPRGRSRAILPWRRRAYSLLQQRRGGAGGRDRPAGRRTGGALLTSWQCVEGRGHEQRGHSQGRRRRRAGDCRGDVLSVALADAELAPLPAVVHWPKPLPGRWVLGGLGGICVDAKDHVLILASH